MKTAPLRVAVVDDSSFVRRAIARMLEGDRRIEIVGLAASGEELLAHLEQWRPDAVTLDLSMPGMGGLLTLDQIMAVRPTPVIVLSTHSAKDAPLTIEALHRGAIDFIDKQQYSLVDFQALRGAILEKLLSLGNASLPAKARPPSPGSAVVRGQGKVAANRSRSADRSSKRSRLPAAARAAPAPRNRTGERRAKVAPLRHRKAVKAPSTLLRFEVLAMGASTGGPPTLQKILEQLGAVVPIPVVLVQHMPIGFTRAFAERLNSYLPLQVREAQHGEVLEPSTVYIAPAGNHLQLERLGDRLVAQLSDQRGPHSHCPSVDVLFESVARTCRRRALVGLLTGMGSDGARGMKEVRARGGYTLAQDADSCVVYGMPKAAVAQRAVCEELGLETFGSRLTELFGTASKEDPL